MKRISIGVAAVVVALAFATAAQARYMPSYLAKSEIQRDGREAQREVSWSGFLSLGRCGTYNPTRYECQVQLEGKRPVDYDVERGIIYELHFCSWVGVAKWRGRYVIVKRRELHCEESTETSR